MFGGLANLIQSSTQVGPPPKDVPPPTPVELPQGTPAISRDTDPTVRKLPSLDDHSESSLVRFLQTLHRPADLNELHFAALGVHVHVDTPAEDLLPDPSYLPSTSGWDDITIDQARERDPTFRRPISNGNISPEARVYMERRNELSVPNQAAFRTVKRMKPELGKAPIRLGNCYEFFKQMELMARFWDDTSLPPPAEGDDGSQTAENVPAPPLPSGPSSVGTGLEQAGAAMISSAAESNARSQPKSDTKSETPERVTYRTQPGSEMPPEYRHNLVAAFVKLVSYDFGCNIVPSRVEPRLHLLGPPSESTESKPHSQSSPRLATYFPSGCVFVNRIPTARDAARAGVVEGPLAAVSARNTTHFSSPADSNIDLGRELIAALTTAQLRARQGKAEHRFGEDKWWATTKRWGGGEGGAIGREVETGDHHALDKGSKDSTTAGAGSSSESGPGTKDPRAPSHSLTATKTPLPGGLVRPSGAVLAMRGQPASKRQRKTPSIYDHYRMVRPPASNWDRKARYEAIGRARGVDYDDVFVFSSLFHHFCILRVRVPDRLLEVLGGGADAEDGKGEEKKKTRSWGELQVWRSRWFDLFLVEDRLEAMRQLWGVMAWLMRKEDEPKGAEDVTMEGV
ncbi:hypothetical protein DL767_005070 [Monosporascus sp. MG133]|nr:hypothetical protein DL767_005070 [Monosporascus sp. MG133]